MIIYDNKDIKKQIVEINETFSEIISAFMGTDLKLNLSGKKANDEYSISVGAKFITFISELNNKIIKDICFNAFNFIEKYINDNDAITARLYNNLIDEVSMSLIFPDYFKADEETKLRQLRFVEDLKKISFKTYECNSTEMGILFVPSDIDIKDIISKLPFEYIKLQGNKTIIELIESEKPMLKIIDNKSVSLVIDHNFFVTGIIKKRQGKKSIQQVFEEIFSKNDTLYLKLSIYKELIRIAQIAMNKKTINAVINDSATSDISTSDKEKILNYLNGKGDEYISLVEAKIKELEYEITESACSIKYITIKNREITYYGNENFLLVYGRGSWKIKHYTLMLAYIFEYITPVELIMMFHTPVYDKDILFKEIDILLMKICKLIKVMKSLTLNNNGALFIILKSGELKKDNNEYLNKIIPKDLLRNKSKEIEEFKKVIRNNDNSITNILDMDDYLLECIASVDGATIFDDDFNLISFSELVNSKGNGSKNKQKIYGARTNAAISASKYGLAVKVSEDGDIEIYKDGKRKMRI